MSDRVLTVLLALALAILGVLDVACWVTGASVMDSVMLLVTVVVGTVMFVLWLRYRGDGA